MFLNRYISLFIGALMITACSSNSTLEEERIVDDRLPMVFGSSYASSEAAATRAATALQDDARFQSFKVGVWKNYGTPATQQNVMDGYRVDYNTSTNWKYEGIGTQVLRYWDLSAFPYEFRAVAPYLENVTIAPERLTINEPFHAQQLINDTYTPASPEPCVVAHVSRKKTESGAYVDTDMIKNEEINNAAGTTNATRSVHLPFHHLNSKIGFRIFIDNPMPLYDDYTISIQSIKITIVNPNKDFITKTGTYTATNEQGLLKGTFSNNTTATGEFTLLEHGLYKDGDENHWNFHYHLNKNQAFDLTPNYLHQIPQSGFQIRVQLVMKTHHVESEDVTFNYDSILSTETLKDTDITGDYFTWEPEKRYIYYLHIPNMHGHEVVLHTCEVLPWDGVQTANIDVEL